MESKQVLEPGTTYFIDATECHRGVYQGKKEGILFFEPLDRVGYARDDKGRVMFYDNGYKYKEVANGD